MALADSVRQRVSNLETKHYYMIGGGVAVVVIIIVLLSVLSGSPGERFGESCHGGEVAHLVFDHDGTRLASSELSLQAKVLVWELSTGKLLGALDGNATDSRMIAFPADREVLITAGLDERVLSWGIETGGRRQDLKIPLSACSALSPDGKWLAYCKGPKIFVWNLSMKPDKENDIFDGDATGERAVVFSPDSKLLVTGSSSGVLRLYEPDKKSQRVPPKKGHESAIACVVFSPEGHAIGTASRDNAAKLWDTAGTELAAFEGHEGAVEVIAVGPGAKLVLTGSRDRTARLWAGESGQELFKFENFRGKSESMVAISADGRFAAIETTHAGVEVFETDSGTSIKKIDVPVSVFAFSPSGNTLYFGCANGVIYTWTRGAK